MSATWMIPSNGIDPRHERGRIDAPCQVPRQSGEVCWVSNESDPGGGLRSMTRPGVRLLTIHGAKGLEFRDG